MTIGSYLFSRLLLHAEHRAKLGRGRGGSISVRSLSPADGLGATSLKTIFETCTPREEVLKGELKEQQFAASLTKVLRGTAEEVYGEPATFFANTYPTGGLKSLLREALGRLFGEATERPRSSAWKPASAAVRPTT